MQQLEKVARLGITKEAGWVYLVDGPSVVRVRFAPKAREIVADFTAAYVRGTSYVLDADGDVARPVAAGQKPPKQTASQPSQAKSKPASAKGASTPPPVSFDAADRTWKLTRYGAFDAAFSHAVVHEGDLHLGARATGAHLLSAFGRKEAPKDATAFVVTGDLVVDGAFDVDAGLNVAIGLIVLGALRADVVRLDMSMLSVFGGAEVRQAIFFTTNDGTLSIAGQTRCPLIVVHEGDFNFAATGEVFNATAAGPLAESDERNDDNDDDDDGFPLAKVTMTRAEASVRLVPEVFNDGDFDADEAYARAVNQRALLRARVTRAQTKDAAPKKAATKKAATKKADPKKAAPKKAATKKAAPKKADPKESTTKKAAPKKR